MFDAFTFQKDDNGVIILVLLKPASNTKPTKWVLLVRPPNEQTGYCVTADGNDVGVLKDMHNNGSEKRFGMPGSGEPRCSSYNDPAGSLNVRWWANRELGESTIIYTESTISNNCVYLMNNDNNWIILETKKDQYNTTCYFNRGQTLLTLVDEYFLR
jgi:hypothetical protein